MNFTDLGFIFIILPVAAAVYYLFSAKNKPFILFLLSSLVLLFKEPHFALTLILLLPDFWFSHKVIEIEENKRSLLCRLLVLKNFIFIITCGIILPFEGVIAAPFGSLAITFTSMELVILRNREGFRPCSFFEAAAACSFMGRFAHGTVGSARTVISQLKKPSPSISSISRGGMLIISGTAKRYILAEQFFALFKTISRMSVSQYSLILGWLCALCGGLGLYFTVSAYSDIAVGLGKVFSINLPQIVYYPFQAKSLRDYVYRLNMPLEDSINRLLLPNIKREEAKGQNYVVSLIMPFALALFLSPTGGFLLWSLYLSALVVLDWLLFKRLPAPVAFLSRIVTFIITLPSYVLLLPAPLKSRFEMLLSMVHLGGYPIINDDIVYLLSTNYALIILGSFFCTSIISTLSRATEKQLPQLWWVISTAAHLTLLFLTVSFLVWNVR